MDLKTTQSSGRGKRGCAVLMSIVHIYVISNFCVIANPRKYPQVFQPPKFRFDRMSPTCHLILRNKVGSLYQCSNSLLSNLNFATISLRCAAKFTSHELPKSSPREEQNRSFFALYFRTKQFQIASRIGHQSINRQTIFFRIQ